VYKNHQQQEKNGAARVKQECKKTAFMKGKKMDNRIGKDNTFTGKFSLYGFLKWRVLWNDSSHNCK